MKHYFKQIVAVALMLAMTVIPTFAAAQPALSATLDFSAALDSYFAVRGETLVSSARRASTLSTSFSALETTRAQNFAAIDNNIEVVDATANYVVVNSEVSGNTAVLDVYEWSWLEYYADETVTSTNTMGFGTEHRITLNKVNGEWVMASDKYDESDITGVSTLAPGEELVLNYDRALLNEVYAATVGAEQLREATITDEEINVANNQTRDTNSSIGYDPFAAINYADSYVYPGFAYGGHSGSGGWDDIEGKMRQKYYNKEYTYYPRADCCNYVSQCLVAGGMPMDNIWNGTKTGTEDEPAIANDYTATSEAWRLVSSFVNYWKNTKGYTESPAVTIDETDPEEYSVNVTPGNPAYYVDEEGHGHVVICVGYNAGGAPIFNSHNRDMYHCTFDLAAGEEATSYKTLALVADPMTNTPNVAHDFGVVGSTVAYGLYFLPYKARYVKFTVETAGTYSVYSSKFTFEPELDTYGQLFEESDPTEGGHYVYMKTLDENDNASSSSVSFRISQYLTPGTYYVLVRPKTYSDTGYAYVHVVPGT